VKPFVSLSGITLKKNAMKTFKISFQDAQGNELWMSITEKHNIDEATKYANLILATSMVNDVESFEIYEA
jgi:hypothetical protein